MILTEYIKEKLKNRPLYMPYLTAGDPSYSETVRFAVGMIDSGADIIELGVPFSDPTADGPVIQAAMERSLRNEDFSMDKVFRTASSIHQERPNIPIVLLTYLNPILQWKNEGVAPSIDAFLRECKACGILGVVIPDLPEHQEESGIFRMIGERYGVNQILMAAPNASAVRLREVSQAARGFIYYVTSLGVTGERKELPPDLTDRVKLVKEASGLPVFAGFGFSHPDQTKGIRGVLDGVIVGSLNHRIISEQGSASLEELKKVTASFVHALSS